MPTRVDISWYAQGVPDPTPFSRNGHGPLPPGGPPPVLSDPSLDPIFRLQMVLRAEERSREEWDEAILAEADVDPSDWDLLENARKNIRNAYRRWFEISQQAHDLSEAVRKSKLEGSPRPDSDLIKQLQAQFQGGGPHYDLLCERVAGLHSRLKFMEASGRDFSPQEHATLNTQLLSYVNQLQKYTEAMKSETISKETQEAVEEVLRIVERHLGTTYLEVWHAVVVDVRRALEDAA